MDPLWLSADFPRLFHVAEAGAWASIERHGLLSTSALLDLFQVDPGERNRWESEHRPNSVTLLHPEHGRAMLRDQGPLDVRQLEQCLEGEITVVDWLRILNRNVFFWPTEDRLNRLLGAAAYRDREHDVLIVDTRPLVGRYRSSITLTQINTGAIGRARAKRGRSTFRSIALYPDAPKERRRIAEVVVEYAVPDIAEYVLRVERRKGTRLIGAPLTG